MLKKMRQIAVNHMINIRGWRTERKILVFESDDWGAARMSSKESLSLLKRKGIKVQNCHYVQNDALASEEDLNLFFQLLKCYKNLQGKHPVITANVIMTNPDYEKIESSDFLEYYSEPFTETLKRYPKHNNSFEIWKCGIKEGLFKPQFHGREHLQVKRWMNFLKNPDSETRIAFKVRVYGLSTSVTSEYRKSYLATYDWDDNESHDFVIKSIHDGLIKFKDLFGYPSLSSIAPNYTWHRDVEQVLKDHGVCYLQGSSVQRLPSELNDKSKKSRHFLGQKNDLGQSYLVRNCKFEPSSNPTLDWVDKCLKDIKTAFLWKKPAIIEMHRVNFVGFINSENRDRNLREFEKLLKLIIRKWPEVEFMTTDQLGKLILEHE